MKIKTSLVFIMRVSFLQIAIVLSAIATSLAGEIKAQAVLEQKISININKADVGTILKSIEKVSDAKFVYSSTLIAANRKISVSAVDLPLGNVLNKILPPLQLAYEVTGDVVLIRRVPTAGEGTSVASTELINPAKITITGIVTDAKNQPLPGVTVGIKGTAQGTITDPNGKYSISVPDGNAVLVFGFVGFTSQEITVNNRTTINVQLVEESRNLNEVVVVGYGTQKKRDVTGAVGSVSLTNTAKTPVFGTGQLLQGQVSGVQVTQTNSQPGASFTVRVRGTNSINFSSDPLYVVDGYAGADFSALNPNDIASIDVLKDASSTAIYGNRGANGVVIITTKNGSAGKKSVTADVYSGVQNVGKILPMMNAQQFATYLNQVTSIITPTATLPFTQAQIDNLGEGTNWQKEIFRKAAITNANLAITGGNADTKFLVSLGYFDQKGIILNFGYKRGTLRFNLTQAVSKKINFGINSQLSYDQQNLANVNTTGGSTGGTLLDALRISPTVSVYNPDGTYTFQNGPTGFTTVLGNPVAAAMLNTDVANNMRVFANAYGDYEIIKNLKLKVSIGTDDKFNREAIFRPSTTYLGAQSSGYAQIINPINYNWLNENTLTYNTVINKIHSISALAGFTYQEFKYTSSTSTAQSLTTNNLSTDNLSVGSNLSAASTTNRNALASFLGRINYSLMDRYLLTASIRRDGASPLGVKSKWGTFPSASFAWRVSEESFLKDIKAISDLKLRVGYGSTGNSNIPAYSSITAYSFNSYVLNGNRVVGYHPMVLPTTICNGKPLNHTT